MDSEFLCEKATTMLYDHVITEGRWEKKAVREHATSDGGERELKGSSDCGHLKDCVTSELY
jgi:hypothetical protein